MLVAGVFYGNYRNACGNRNYSTCLPITHTSGPSHRRQHPHGQFLKYNVIRVIPHPVDAYGADSSISKAMVRPAIREPAVNFAGVGNL